MPARAEVKLLPTGTLSFRFASDDERRRFEEFVEARTGEVVFVRRDDDGYLTELGPLEHALLEAFLGREVAPFVRVEASYAFDWRPLGALDAAFADVWPRLPGLVEVLHGGAAFFGTGDIREDDTREPPWLDALFEPHALEVNGVVTEADFRAWHVAFVGATGRFPSA